MTCLVNVALSRAVGFVAPERGNFDVLVTSAGLLNLSFQLHCNRSNEQRIIIRALSIQPGRLCACWAMPVINNACHSREWPMPKRCLLAQVLLILATAGAARCRRQARGVPPPSDTQRDRRILLRRRARQDDHRRAERILGQAQGHGRSRAAVDLDLPVLAGNQRRPRITSPPRLRRTVPQAGFHVAGIDVGTSCGSPSAARLCQDFYKRLISEFNLNRKARLVVQSNGGLIGYGWAFRYPEGVDRIFGICPVTDFRTWPTLPTVITAPAPGLGYDLTLAELTRRITEFNPVDNLAPLAKARVKILHIHGDKDELVPLSANSAVVMKRFKDLGGNASLVTLKGLGHGGNEFYESRDGVEFLLGN